MVGDAAKLSQLVSHRQGLINSLDFRAGLAVGEDWCAIKSLLINLLAEEPQARLSSAELFLRLCEQYFGDANNIPPGFFDPLEILRTRGLVALADD